MFPKSDKKIYPIKSMFKKKEISENYRFLTSKNGFISFIQLESQKVNTHKIHKKNNNYQKHIG
jgi:hypothetical protein